MRGRSWAEATAMRTGGRVVDQVDVDGLAVSHEGTVDDEGSGCPRPAPFPAAFPPNANDMVQGWGQMKEGWVAGDIPVWIRKLCAGSTRLSPFGYQASPLNVS